MVSAEIAPSRTAEIIPESTIVGGSTPREATQLDVEAGLPDSPSPLATQASTSRTFRLTETEKDHYLKAKPYKCRCGHKSRNRTQINQHVAGYRSRQPGRHECTNRDQRLWECVGREYWADSPYSVILHIKRGVRECKAVSRLVEFGDLVVN